MRTASKQPLPGLATDRVIIRVKGLGGRLALGLAAGLLAWIVGVGQSATTAQAQPGANQAGVVIRHGDGRVVTACVSFDEPQITGIQLLQRSGLDLNVEASSTGAGVCRLDGEGCSVPQQSCFCQCEGATCNYWSYWQLHAEGWQYSNFGASGSEIKPGQVDGWAWGAGATEGTNGKPPALTFADVCTASTPTGIPTGTPTAAPATATPASTSTPTITPTPFPTAVPLGSPPRIETFTADATQLAPGQVATLHWRVVDAASVTLVAGGQRVPVGAEGTTTLAPPGDVEVRLEAANNSGTTTGSVQLQVIQPLVTAARAAPGPVFTPTPLPVPAVALLAVPAAAIPAAAAASAPPTTLPATRVPQAPPAPQLTARLLLPLVLRDLAHPASASPRSDTSSGGTYSSVTGAPVLTATVLAPAAAIVVATPTAIPAAVLPTALPAALPTAALATESAGAAATGPSRAQSQDTNRLLWTALAALLILPSGIGLLAYLAWRLISRRG
jgi:hypothetical protein